MTPAQHWARAFARFSPAVRTVGRAAIARLRTRLPGAVEFIYDNYNALVLGFGGSDRPSDAIFSIVLYPRWVNLGFIEGAQLADPTGRLKGSGSQFRHIRLDRASTLDEPVVRALIDQSIERSGFRFPQSRRRKMMLRAVSRKQRPRRPRA